MNKYISLLFLTSSLLLVACGPVDPKKYFDVAVLNVNFLTGFANSGQLRELESPSVKLSEKNGQPETMLRKEVIESKIDFVQKNLEKLNDLAKTEDSKEIMQASLELYNYVLPVYKTEYAELAKMYDEKVSTDQIENKSEMINEKYFQQYDQLYNQLITAGKRYAKKHSIQVNWGS